MRKFLFFIGSVLILFSCTTRQDNKTVSTKTPVALPEIISVADLEDSMQPVQIYLTDFSNPLRIKVPTHSFGSYSHLNESGRGHLWFATNVGGVSRFDDNIFKT